MKGKLIRYIHNKTPNALPSLGFLPDPAENMQDISENKREDMIAPIEATHDMNELIVHFESFNLNASTPRIPLSDVQLLAPIKSPLQDVICLGINYMEHAKESARFKKEICDTKREEAIYFSKRVNECTNPNASFSIGAKTTQLDYEVELVVIIGKDCTHATRANAMDFVFGYSMTNDISARDIQLKHKQWYAGKSLEGSFPLGPCIVLRDSLNPHNLTIKSYVNNQLRQNSNTSKLIFDIPHAICELSSYFTLKAGSIISMGTPDGVGMGFNPPKFLKAGDVVKCEIEDIGVLQTFIQA